MGTPSVSRYSQPALDVGDPVQDVLARRELEAWLDRQVARYQNKLVQRTTDITSTVGLVRMVPGGDFLLDDDKDLPGIWGPPGSLLWASGESLMVYGPPGVYKSTLVQWLVLARIGLVVDEVLGHKVVDNGGRVLYLAMDRPTQVRRSLRRMVRADQRDLLNQRLTVHRGPLPVNLTTERHQRWLAEVCMEGGYTTVVLDSLKDVAPRLHEDEPASGYNLARQETLASGIELIEIHHNRKSGKDGRNADTLDDVYGSRHITSGAGSVLGLFGEVDKHGYVVLRQLKALENFAKKLWVTMESTTGVLTASHTAPERLTEGWLEVHSVLMRRPDGMTLAEITREVTGDTGRDARKRMAERLRRMKEKDAARHVDDRWLLP
jgi:replicative DNA helicase